MRASTCREPRPPHDAPRQVDPRLSTSPPRYAVESDFAMAIRKRILRLLPPAGVPLGSCPPRRSDCVSSHWRCSAASRGSAVIDGVLELHGPRRSPGSFAIAHSCLAEPRQSPSATPCWRAMRCRMSGPASTSASTFANANSGARCSFRHILPHPSSHGCAAAARIGIMRSSAKRLGVEILDPCNRRACPPFCRRAKRPGKGTAGKPAGYTGCLAEIANSGSRHQHDLPIRPRRQHCLVGARSLG